MATLRLRSARPWYPAWRPAEAASISAQNLQRGGSRQFCGVSAAVDFSLGIKLVFDPLMASLGYDPNNKSTDTNTPSGVGNVACAAVLNFRHNDGSNQLGNLTASGAPYADYTGFVPLNPPSTVPVNPATVVDVNHWQPLRYFDATGTFVTPFPRRLVMVAFCHDCAGSVPSDQQSRLWFWFS